MKKKRPRWRITIGFSNYRAGKRRWVWRLWKNGRFFTGGSNNYSRRSSCVRAVKDLAEALGAEAECSADLREFNNGVAANKRREEVQELYVAPGDSFLDWQPYPEAETWRRFHLRVASYMDRVMEGQDKPLLMVCHGGTIVQIVSWWLRLPVETLNWVNFHSYPTGVTVLTETKWGERRLERLNDTSHLRDMSGVEPIPTEPVEKTMKH